MGVLQIFFITVILFTASKVALGQTYEWSNTQKLRGNAVYTTVIGEDESGIYVLRHRNKFLSKFIVLERYRHNLGLENSKSLLLKNTRILYADMNESGILLIKETFDKKANTFKLIAVLLNNSFENIQPEILIALTKKTISGDEPFFFIKPSPDHKRYLILNYSLTNINQNINQFLIIDQKMNTIDSGKFKIESNRKIESVEDVVFDKTLNFTILLKLTKGKSGLSHFAVYEKDTLKYFMDSVYSFENPVLFYNPVTNKKGVSGYYTSDIKNGFEGDFSFVWDNLKTHPTPIKKNPFSYSILKELSGETKAQTGFLALTYHPLKLISRSDGGFIKISENTYTQRDQDIVTINGVSSSQGKNIYTFENLLLQSFDSSGNPDWENWVTKYQNTINDGGMLGSVCIAATETSINILFNDPIATGGDIILATFFPNGQKETKVAVKGDEMNAFIIPAEGRQISGDKMIIPVLKDRKFALLKITFKQ